MKKTKIFTCKYIHKKKNFPGGTMVKNLPAKAGDTRDLGLIPNKTFNHTESLLYKDISENTGN